MIELRDREHPRRSSSAPGQPSGGSPTPTARSSSSTTIPISRWSCEPTASTSARTTWSRREARRIMGPDAIIGLSTHSREQIEAAAESPVDYISVGPIWETPTKEGRPATGLELIRDAAESRPQALVRDRRHRHRQCRSRSSRRAPSESAWCGRSGTPRTREPRPRPSSTRSTPPPEGDRELMAGARDRKRAERQKRKRRSTDRTPRSGRSGRAERRDRRNEWRRPRRRRPSRSAWRGATRSATPRPARSSSPWTGGAAGGGDRRGGRRRPCWRSSSPSQPVSRSPAWTPGDATSSRCPSSSSRSSSGRWPSACGERATGPCSASRRSSCW